jgi:hypothetical protein
MSRVIAVVACGLSLAACSASMPSLSFLSSTPPTEALRIESEPPNAEAKTSLGQTCRTPCELKVEAAKELTVSLTLAGYQPQTVNVRPGTPSGQEPDAAPPRLAPNPIYVELAPVTAAPTKKRPAKKKPKPATTAAASPAPALEPAPAAAAPPVAPTAAAEPAASPTQYPWPSR